MTPLRCSSTATCLSREVHCDVRPSRVERLTKRTFVNAKSPPQVVNNLASEFEKRAPKHTRTHIGVDTYIHTKRNTRTERTRTMYTYVAVITSATASRKPSRTNARTQMQPKDAPTLRSRCRPVRAPSLQDMLKQMRGHLEDVART